ncbi:rhomboid-related protein 2 isoform X2 [Anabrus simplex]|uniref:rhomboid-related protein 2 isoform X2 n=1 Tax=Anabrus simplex TaxID=316456 RepID=UPI0035A2BA1C
MPSNTERRRCPRQAPPTEITVTLRRDPNDWRTIFQSYDLDNDGVISLRELKERILSETYKNDIPEETVCRIMQKIDLDGNGYIDLKEFERLHWTRVFNWYDRDGDGLISPAELSGMIQEGEERLIPKATEKRLAKMADGNGDNRLDFEEFLKLVEMKEFRVIMGDILNKYVRLVVVPRYRESDEVDGRLHYEQQYSCCPPKLCMVIISIVEAALFAWDAFKDGKTDGNGPVATALLYDPKRRYEGWRYLTYMFVHAGFFHLIVNLVIQILLGIPLEMVHHWWRVLIIYLGGVLFGSLGTSISDPYVRLVGASGGVYALVTAHLASIVMNWSEMRFAPLQFVFFLIVFASTIGKDIYYRYINDEDDRIGYEAHLFGALAGFLLGISVLRNLHVLKWERVLWWASIFVFVGFISAAIAWNAAFLSYFPHPEYSS